ncbi:MAG: GLUG motif-containing protein [Bradymonadaceae bacterium]
MPMWLLFLLVFAAGVLVGAAPLSPIASASARGFLAEPDVVDPVASADHSTITGVNGLADGLSPADVTIYLADADGSPVVGVVPVFEATGYENSYGLCSATNDEGISTCTLLSTVGEMKTLHLTSPVEVEGNEVTFVQGCNPAGDPFGGGRGTEAHPHTLCGADQLNRINGQGLARHFQLFADIDMANTDFQIIGSQNQFSGVFDGQGYSISNLVIDNAQATPAGFFGYLSGEVFDLSLIDIDILARHSVGGLAGLAFDARIEDVVVQGVVEATEDLVGGLVGSISAGTVERAYLDVEVIGQDIVGGLVGELHSVGQINASTVAGTVAGENTVGGLAGLVRQESSIEDSSSTATVSATGSGAGGFVGTLQGNSILQETSATGDVSGEVDVGGLVGRVLQSYVYSSLATGGVSSTRTTGNSNTGGLIGFVTTGHVEDSYAAGSVDGHFNAGGLIGTLGTINANDTDQAIVNRTYAVGLVTGANTPGGLVGIVFSNVTITSSYWNTETTNQGSSAGGTGRTTEEMGEESNFVGWVFSPAADHVWVMPVGGPPMLWFE